MMCIFSQASIAYFLDVAGDRQSPFSFSSVTGFTSICTLRPV